MDDYLGSRNETQRLQAWMIGEFGASALALAGVGIFGLVAGSVADRKVTAEDMPARGLGTLLLIAVAGVSVWLAGANGVACGCGVGPAGRAIRARWT